MKQDLNNPGFFVMSQRGGDMTKKPGDPASREAARLSFMNES